MKPEIKKEQLKAQLNVAENMIYEASKNGDDEAYFRWIRNYKKIEKELENE